MTTITLQRTATGLRHVLVNGRTVTTTGRIISVNPGKFDGHCLETNQGLFFVYGGVAAGAAADEWFIDVELYGRAGFTLDGYKSATAAVRQVADGI